MLSWPLPPRMACLWLLETWLRFVGAPEPADDELLPGLWPTSPGSCILIANQKNLYVATSCSSVNS